MDLRIGLVLIRRGIKPECNCDCGCKTEQGKS